MTDMTQPGSDPQSEGNLQATEAAPDAGDQSAVPDEEQFIYLRADELQSEIARLERENETFKRLFNSRIGDKAAKQYKPQIDERDRKIEELNMELRKRDILAMDDEEVESRFASDPQFAQEYAQLVHYQPQSEVEDDTPQIQAAVNESFEMARSFGLDEDTIREVQTKAANGDYDDGGHWSGALQRMNADITQRIYQKSQNKTNPSISQSGPDLTPANRKRGSAALEVPKTVSEFKQLPESRQREILDDPEGYAAVEELVKNHSKG